MPSSSKSERNLSVLFVVEGFTDIRFVKGLSEICELTLLVSEAPFRESGLADRIAQMKIPHAVIVIPGGRLSFQLRSFGWLWRNVHHYDLILSQELLRGSFNATIAARGRGVPIITYVTTPAVEYYRCRRERGEIGWFRHRLGELVIRALNHSSGRLSNLCLPLGSYLTQQVAPLVGNPSSRPASRIGKFLYYGVDTTLFRPVSPDEKRSLREELGLPGDRFLILFSSRLSHEKDPETLLRAASQARQRGLDVAVLNLSGQFARFIGLAQKQGIRDAERWVHARPAIHPMGGLHRYYQAADLLVQSSLAEGCGLSPLEALACGTPVIASAVGGLTAWKDHCWLVPRSAAGPLGEAIRWVADHPEAARRRALDGRRYVEVEWERERAFTTLQFHFRQCLVSR